MEKGQLTKAQGLLLLTKDKEKAQKLRQIPFLASGRWIGKDLLHYPPNI
jgi:hypothetical protein